MHPYLHLCMSYLQIMLGVRPPATQTFLIMPPPAKTKKKLPLSQGHAQANIQALYDTILQDTHPKLVRRRNVEIAQLSTMYGGKVNSFRLHFFIVA